MKKITFIFSLMLIGFQTFSQVDPKQTDVYKIAEKQYHLGLKYNDLSVTKSALYTLIAINPDDYSLRDSLAYIYFDYKQFTSSALVALDILKKYPNYEPALEMAAVSFENLGLLDKAAENFEALYLRTNNAYTLYKVAFLQYQLKKNPAALVSLDGVISDKNNLELKLSFPISESDSQEVPLKAAALNLKGLIYLAMNENENAKKAFNDALVIQQDFKVARDNLESIDKK